MESNEEKLLNAIFGGSHGSRKIGWDNSLSWVQTRLPLKYGGSFYFLSLKEF